MSPVMPRLDWIEFEGMMDAHDGARDRVPRILDAAILLPLLQRCNRAADAVVQRESRRKRGLAA